MEEGDGVDEGEIFFLVAAEAGVLVGEGQARGEGVDDFERSQEALGVLVGAAHDGAAAFALEAFEGAGFALELMDAAGLLAAFVNC